MTIPPDPRPPERYVPYGEERLAYLQSRLDGALNMLRIVADLPEMEDHAELKGEILDMIAEV